MNWIAHFWRYCKQTQASQIAEFAVSLPLLAVVVIGITDFGSAFDLKYKLSNAVRAGARVASAKSTSDDTDAVPVSVRAVRDAVDSYLIGDHVNDCGLATATPTQSASTLVWTYTGKYSMCRRRHTHLNRRPWKDFNNHRRGDSGDDPRFDQLSFPVAL
jgi:hypothetical protein